MKKVLALLLVVSAVGFVIGGCNKGADDAGAAAPATTGGTAGAAAPTAGGTAGAATPAAPAATTTGG